jgi:hypothetical protein
MIRHIAYSHLSQIFCLLFIIVTTQYSQAQLRVDKVIPPSFNATAIIKYCDHPVGTKYGVPKIKYAIKTLMNDGLYIPISMTYHAMGIKVEEEATWVGLGWNLNAGGQITRIVRGENDFGISENIVEKKAPGYPFENIKPCFDDCEENENDDFHRKVCAGEIDSDPDIFFYDILGNKGKFLLTPDHDPQKEYIEINIVRPRKMLIKFFIKENYWVAEDSRGTKYTFKTREITDSYDNYFDYKFDSHKLHFKNHYNTLTSSWYLDNVEMTNGASAQFNYDTNPDGSSNYSSNSSYHKMNINDGDVWDLHYSSYCFPDDIENVQIVSENMHRDIYLKSIDCGAYRVNFTTSEQENTTPLKDGLERYRTEIKKGYNRQKLDKIEVLKNGEIVSSNALFYSYFNEEVFGEEACLYQRLKLDSLVTKNGEKDKTYGFTYEEEISLPSKESHARDLWGYYNGEEDQYNITPSDFFNYSQPEKLLQEEGKTKHYSLEYIQAAILKKVDYGNGRTREFAYDHQEFNDVDEEISGHFTSKMKGSNFNHHLHPFIFGGLRIKEIIDSFPTEKIYKDFVYSVDGNDTGNLIITHYNHGHHGYGHKTSGNHSVKYKKVKIRTGKLFRGTKF